MRLFNEEEKEYIKKIYKGKTTKEISEMFNCKFNRNITPKQIHAYKTHNKLVSGIDTKFKKNQKAHNHKPIGYEFTTKDRGFDITYIKVAEPNEWVKKQKYIYEKYKGKVPSGYSVCFANGNHNDFSLDNLILVENRDKLIMKNKHLFTQNKELTNLGIQIAHLINKASDRRKEV